MYLIFVMYLIISQGLMYLIFVMYLIISQGLMHLMFPNEIHIYIKYSLYKVHILYILYYI